LNKPGNRGAEQTKSAHNLLHWHLLVVAVLVLGYATIGAAPVFAQTGTATSSATPSNASPNIGQQIVVSINIDMSRVAAPDDRLGSLTASLNWDPAVLAYSSHSGILAGFTGAVNSSGAATGHIIFDGANPSGATGDIIVLTIAFNALAAGTSALNLEYSAMAATVTFANLLPILTVTDGQVVVGPAHNTPTPTPPPGRYRTYLPLLAKEGATAPGVSAAPRSAWLGAKVTWRPKLVVTYRP
jgi:hypothetical protein